MFISNTDSEKFRRQLEDLKLDLCWYSRTEEMEGKTLTQKKPGFFKFISSEIEQLITSGSFKEEIEELIL